MENKRKTICNRLKLIGFSAYFLILFIERLLAVILSPTHGEEYALSSGNGFNYFAYSVTAFSLLCGTVLFVRLLVGVGRAFGAKQEYSTDDHIKEWCVASAVLLFSGMMHTGFTLPGLQFAAYGFLIGAMVVKCVEECLGGADKFAAITSLVYLTLFSMSIPVCYISFADAPWRELFFAVQAAAVFALVPIFGVMLFTLMKKGVTSFSWIFPAVMAVLSGATVALVWTERVNWFVLIFAGLTLLCYLTFGLIVQKRMREKIGC